MTDPIPSQAAAGIVANHRRSSLADPDNPLDIKDPDAHVSDAVFERFRALRADGPVQWHSEVGDRGFWAVLGYDEAARVLRDAQTYSADKRNGGNRIFDDDKVTETSGRMLLMIDPPDLNVLRKAISGSFTPAAVDALQPRLRERAERLVRAIAPRGEAEFVSEVSGPFTMGLATDLFGLPEETGPDIGRWMSILIADDDPEISPSADVRKRAVEEFDAFARRLHSGEIATTTDLVANLAGVEFSGRPLDFEDFSVNVIALLVAMTDTTRHALSFAVSMLPQDAGLRSRICEDPALLRNATREIIRWSSPLIHVRRTAMCDTELGGKKIGAGDKVVVWYLAANRDPSRYEDPDALDLARFSGERSAASLAFGAGPHHCLGWRYAELELAIMLRELLTTVPDIRPAGPQVRMRSNFIRGIRRLPVEFTPVQT